MDTIFAYLLKCVISSGVLTVYYWFALRNKKFHGYNRFYLLSTLLLSLALPFLHFQWFSLGQQDRPYLTRFVQTIGYSGTLPASLYRFSWSWLLIIIALLVSAVLLIVLFIRILRIWREIRGHGHIRMKGVCFIETKLEHAPFSFLNYLFWKKAISLDSDNGQKIFKHELTHIEQKHTYDKLFSQLVVCFLWVNPFYWIIQRELNMIHEFIADERSVNDGDTESFARMLLLSHNGGLYLDPSHRFFQSPKRRLVMITRSTMTRFSYGRRVLAVPVIIMILSLFSFTVLQAGSAAGTKLASEQKELKRMMDAKHRAESLSLRRAKN
jgi:hypothetical protein